MVTDLATRGQFEEHRFEENDCVIKGCCCSLQTRIHSIYYIVVLCVMLGFPIRFKNSHALERMRKAFSIYVLPTF